MTTDTAASVATLDTELRQVLAEQVTTPGGTQAWWALQRQIGTLREQLHNARIADTAAQLEAHQDAQAQADTLHAQRKHHAAAEATQSRLLHLQRERHDPQRWAGMIEENRPRRRKHHFEKLRESLVLLRRYL